MRLLKFLILYGLGLGINLGFVVAQNVSVYDRMSAATVRVWTVVDDDEGNVTEQGGSGLVLSPNYVVTNAHVAFDRDFLLRNEVDPWRQRELAASNLKFTYLISLGPGSEIEASVAWRDATKDVAVLKLSSPLDRQPVSFVPTNWVKPLQTVNVMGFPAAADRAPGAEDYYIPSLTRGIISKEVRKDEMGRKLLQTDAAINAGNSGGPLFNECGEAIGINVEKALTSIRNTKGEIEKVAVGEGIGWALPFEEWATGLDGLQIPYTYAVAPCLGIPVSEGGGSNVGTPWEQRLYLIGLLVAILLGGTSLILVLTRRGRAAVKEAVTRSREMVSKRFATRRSVSFVAGPHVAILECVGGYFEGAAIELKDQPIAIGRDPRMCQLVYPQDKTEVSRRHCIIGYHEKEQTFHVEDCWSKNGTYTLQNGKIHGGEYQLLKAGERFYVGDSANMFEVRLEPIAEA